MTRKRSIASVLDDDPNRPRAVPSTRRIRSTSGILSEELTLNQPATSTHNRNRLVECNCSRCNGQLVDPRTKTIHEITRQSNQDSNDNPEDFPLPTIYLSNEPPTEFRQELNEDYEHGEASTTILSGSQSQENIQQISAESDSDSEFTFLSRKRSRRYTIRQVPANLDNIFEQMNLAEHLTEEDERATDTDTTTGEPDDPDDENLDNFEDYSSPNYEPL
jgi:hypothetical protein